MAARGPYAKGVAKRAEILETALDVIAQNGYSGATVKELADAVGLSQNGLLHYFGSKDALFLEILRFHSDIVTVQVDPEHTDFTTGLLTRILEALSDSLEATGRSRLILSVTMEATGDEHIAHDFIRHRYEKFRELAGAALTEMQTRGEFPADADPATAAAVIASAFDGFVIQWMYDQSLDVVGQMAYLLSALGIRDTSPE